MDELRKTLVERLGLAEDRAEAAIQEVLDYLIEHLPAPAADVVADFAASSKDPDDEQTKVTTAAVAATTAAVNAAGPWAAGVAALARLELPVTPLRRQAAATGPCDLLPEAMPMTIFAGDGFHLRVRDGRVLLLRPTPGVAGRPFEDSVDPEWVREVTATAHRRVAVLRRATIDEGACWAGLYEMTPDHNALIGEAEGVSRFLYATGFSGHGFLMGPAVGEVMRDLYFERTPFVDVSGLTAERFVDSNIRPELNIV